MFIDRLKMTNQDLIKYTFDSFDNNELLPDTYVIDIDCLLENAKKILDKARTRNLELFFMTKQFGRNPYIAKKLIEMGYSGAVVVDFNEAICMIDNGIPIGNVGHLVQIPSNLLEKVILSRPKVITVFSIEIATAINKVCAKHGIVQDILLKVIDFENDSIYDGQIGGLELHEIEGFAQSAMTLNNIKISGVTSFPCLLFDGKITPTNNVNTIKKATEILGNCGIEVVHTNMPSQTSVDSIDILAELGATQGEPGHALTGTTPFCSVSTSRENERVAMVYLSEISHSFRDKSYVYGGGFYSRSNLSKGIMRDGSTVSIKGPSAESIDYHLEVGGRKRYGEPVVMAFRTQLFVLRSTVALVEGLSSGAPKLVGKFSTLGLKHE